MTETEAKPKGKAPHRRSDSTQPRTPNEPDQRDRILDLTERFALLALFGLVILFFSVWSKTSEIFPTTANVQSILGNQAVLMLAALATLVPLVANRFDLSIGATIGLSSIIVAKGMSEADLPVLVACAAGIGVGIGVGLINALLVAVIRINSIIATLGLATVLSGLVQQITRGESITQGISTSFVDFGIGKTLGVPNPALLVGVVALLVGYLLVATPLGRSLYAVGSNEVSARLVGLRVPRIIATSYIVAGALAGLAGALQVAHTGAGNPTIGPQFVLPALAAVFLGAATIRPGRYTVLGTLVAILFLATLTSGLTLAGVPEYVSSYVDGGALILGVALSTLIARHRGRI